MVEALGSVFIDDDLERKELVHKMDTILKSLPTNYRIILQLKYIDGVRVKAIAEKLSLSFKSTESLLFRARKAFIHLFNTSI